MDVHFALFVTYLTFNSIHNDLELINNLHVIWIVLNNEFQKVFDLSNFSKYEEYSCDGYRTELHEQSYLKSNYNMIFSWVIWQLHLIFIRTSTTIFLGFSFNPGNLNESDGLESPDG